MKYHLIAEDTEWKIERAGQDSWILKKRSESDWSSVGIYRSPNEAAVMAGAVVTAATRFGERHLSRLKFVLSSWEVCEQR